MKRQPTPQHLTWFLDLYRNNQLVLNPPYQRKSVWTPKDRTFFLDTIFRNYPAPPIFVHREIDDRGIATFNVVDGKQRLETILLFAENKISIGKDFGDENLNGKKFKDLTTEYRRKFWDYILVVDSIENIEGTNIDEVFDRVNRNSKNLQPQELRHARFDGWFITECENESEIQFWWDIKVSTKAKAKRMKNVQFISELLLVVLESEITGFSHDYLDSMYAKYDSPEETVIDFDLDTFSSTKDLVKTTIALMDEHNQCIDKYCRTSNNMYTLWALITLNHNAISDPAEIAERYAKFMHNVQGFIDAETPDELLDTDGKPSEFKYYVNSKGAATEGPQRKNRLDSLQAILG